MDNKYLSYNDYVRYINIFNLSYEDNKHKEELLEKVFQIIMLKRETVQTSPNLYLKPIMFPDDFRKIDKALNTQKLFKLERDTKIFEDTLRKEGKYTEDEITSQIKKFREKQSKELRIRGKSKKNANNNEVLSLNDLEFLEEE